MKILLMTVLLLPTFAFAMKPQMAETASQVERKLLCEAVNSYLEKNQIDMGLDIKKCLSDDSIQSVLFSEAARVVGGDLTFNAPNRPAFKKACGVAYLIQPTADNIFDDVFCE